MTGTYHVHGELLVKTAYEVQSVRTAAVSAIHQNTGRSQTITSLFLVFEYGALRVSAP
jgi:hypothetical protein